jgi:hypothetical protein
MSVDSNLITLQTLNSFIQINTNVIILENAGLDTRSIKEYYSNNLYMPENFYYLGGVELLSYTDVITADIILKVETYRNENAQNFANSWEMMSYKKHDALFYEFIAIIDFLQSNCITLKVYNTCNI